MSKFYETLLWVNEQIAKRDPTGEHQKLYRCPHCGFEDLFSTDRYCPECEIALNQSREDIENGQIEDL